MNTVDTNTTELRLGQLMPSNKWRAVIAQIITAAASVMLCSLDFGDQSSLGPKWAVVSLLVAILTFNVFFDISRLTEAEQIHEGSTKRPLTVVLSGFLSVSWLVFAVRTQSLIVLATLPLAFVYSWNSFRAKQRKASQAALHLTIVMGVLGLFLVRYWILGEFSLTFATIIWQILTWFLHMFGSSLLSVEGQQLIVNGQSVHVSNFVPFEGLVLISAVWLFSSQPTLSRAARWLGATVILVALHAVWIVLLTTWTFRGLLNESAVLLFDISLVLGLSILMTRNLLRQEPDFVSLSAFLGWSALAFLVLVFVARTDSRPRQSGIVWIDQGHGNWEALSPPPDTTSYGRNTMYTYSWLYQWLQLHYDVRVLDSRIPDLGEKGILIVKMPVVPFDASEKRYMEQFVRKGGTVLAIGDHTNLFGTTDVLNDLLEPYGGRFNPDAVIPTQGTEYRYTPRWWNRTSIVDDVDYIDYQTSCSISASTVSTAPLIVATGVVAEAADYSNDRFFGKLTVTADDRKSPLQLCVALKHGKGKVLLFGDSTIWSSFSFFNPNNKELIDSILQYGLQPMSFSYRAWFCLVIVLAVTLFVSLGKKQWMGIGVTLVVFIVVTRSALGSFESGLIPREETPSVYIESAHSRIDVTTDIRTGRIDDLNNYSHFCATMTRSGLWPEVSDRVWDDPRIPVLILNPMREFTYRDLASIERYVRRGGSLLVMDDALHIESSTSSTLFNHLGIRTKLEQTADSIAQPKGPALADLVFALPLSMIYEPRHNVGDGQYESVSLRLALIGTEPILTTQDGTCIFGLKQVGLGKVYVFTESALFSRLVFGDVWGGVQPGMLRHSLYRLLYNLLGEWAWQKES